MAHMMLRGSGIVQNNVVSGVTVYPRSYSLRPRDPKVGIFHLRGCECHCSAMDNWFLIDTLYMKT